MPALEIDGVILTQSLAILEYLNETHAADWLASASLEKARIRAQHMRLPRKFTRSAIFASRAMQFRLAERRLKTG